MKPEARLLRYVSTILACVGYVAVSAALVYLPEDVAGTLPGESFELLLFPAAVIVGAIVNRWSAVLLAAVPAVLLAFASDGGSDFGTESLIALYVGIPFVNAVGIAFGIIIRKGRNRARQGAGAARPSE